MTQLDAAKLDAAFMHEQAIMQRAQAEAEPYEKEIARICKAYGIDRAQLGKSVGVNMETGEIQRAPAPPQPNK
jgi:phage host-nuclease inhibitor protein Gam